MSMTLKVWNMRVGIFQGFPKSKKGMLLIVKKLMKQAFWNGKNHTKMRCKLKSMGI